MRSFTFLLVSVCICFAIGCTSVDLDRIAEIIAPDVPTPEQPIPEDAEPDEPEQEPADAPWDAIAYIGDGETAVTIGTDYEGRTATLSGSVAATATVERARATFPVVASVGDIARCGDVTLQIVVIRERRRAPAGW